MNLIQATLLSVALVTLSGCGVVSKRQLYQGIEQYGAVSNSITLGESKSNVLAVLLPTQSEIGQRFLRIADKHMENNIKVEIYYMRSSWTSDGLLTDDEFTPYVFNDGVLTAIGWSTLGGPKTRGQDGDTVNVVSTSTTKIITE